MCALVGEIDPRWRQFISPLFFYYHFVYRRRSFTQRILFFTSLNYLFPSFRCLTFLFITFSNYPLYPYFSLSLSNCLFSELSLSLLFFHHCHYIYSLYLSHYSTHHTVYPFPLFPFTFFLSLLICLSFSFSIHVCLRL